MRPSRAEGSVPVTRPRAAGAACLCADDWGMSPGVNLGILDLCRAGLVRRVSLFGNLAGLEPGLKELLALKGLEFSLHLNFTYGRPLSRPEEVPSLVREDGAFLPLGAFARAALAGRLPARELELEARAQARRLKAAGVPLTGVEGHHHVHIFKPVFAAVAGALRGEGLLWARLPADRAHLPSWLAGKYFRRWLLSGKAPPAARGFELRPTMYLRPADLKSAARLEKKVFGKDPVLAHPALYNDLPLMEYADPYQEGRVLEYRKLMELPRPRGGRRRDG